MMESMAAYIPLDRRQAIARGENLADRMHGAVLFADISGYTPLIEALVMEFGPKHGADEVTLQINRVFEALISEVHRFEGSVISFGGDAITCWLEGDNGLRATTCALAMQEAMAPFTHAETSSGIATPLSIKIGVAVGPVRRFRVGDPQIQYLDVLAGTTLDRMAAAEKVAEKGEVVVAPEVISVLGDKFEMTQRQGKSERDHPFAVVTGLSSPSWDDQPGSFAAVATLPLTFATPRLTEAQVRPWLLPPVYDRLQSGQGQFLADIRPVASLFLRFSGIDYDQDDHAGQKLDAYIQWIQHVLADHGGYCLKATIGDKGSTLMATFGAPLAHDDDVYQAVAATLKLRTPPAGFKFIRAVQMGLNQGRVLAGAFGSSTRCAYDLLGHEVNMAARLMMEAKSELRQILVSQEVAHTTFKSYYFDYRGSVQIKGKQERMHIFEVLADHPPFLSALSHSLVGRDSELAQMPQLLEPVLAGEGRILRIEGEPGIGKSYLAAELIRRAYDRGLQVATGTCQRARQNIPYDPWRQIFRALFDLTDTGLLGQERDQSIPWQLKQVEEKAIQLNLDWGFRLPLLGELLGLSIDDQQTGQFFDPQAHKEALVVLAVEVIQIWAKARPLLLLIDDIHWLDEASRELALALSWAIARVPVLVVFIHRPQEQPVLPELDQLSRHYRLRLDELASPDVTSLIANRLRGQPSPLALAFIQAQAHGNPLFIEELVDSLCESDRLRCSDEKTWVLSDPLFNSLRKANCLVRDPLSGEWTLAPTAQLSAADLEIPTSIHGTILSRVDRLPEPHRLSLKVASVIGHDFDLNLLALSHPDQLVQPLLLEQLIMFVGRDLVRQERLQPQPTYVFKHNIIQEVVYDNMLESQQRQLHQAVGIALETLQPGEVERLAYHYSRSKVRDKALLYLGQAAQKTQRKGANETALNYYNQALQWDQRWEWCKGKIEVLHILGRRDEERAELDILALLPQAPPLEVAYLEGVYFQGINNYDQAQQVFEQLLVLSRLQGDRTRELRCLTQLGLIARHLGNYQQVIAHYELTLTDYLNQANYTEVEIQAIIQIYNELGTAYRENGIFDQALRFYKQALNLSQQHGFRPGEAEAFSHLGVLAGYQSDLTDAVNYHRQALAIRRAIGDWGGEGVSLGNLGNLAIDQGDYGQACDYLTQALTIQQAVNNRREQANVLNDLGIVYMMVGDWPAAKSCLSLAQEFSREIGDNVGEAYQLCNLGQVARDQGNLGEAEGFLMTSLELAQRYGDKRLEALCFSHAALVSWQAGQFNQAVERAKAALKIRRRVDGLYRTIDLTTLATLCLAGSHMRSAVKRARQALAILVGCNDQGPEFPWRDYFLCYQVFQAAGETTIAQTALQSAHKLVMAQANKISVPTMRQSFLEQVTINKEIITIWIASQQN